MSISDNDLREEIVRMMLARRWYGHSVDDLAEKHNLKHRHVNKLFIEASRAVSVYGDVTGQVAAKVAELDGIIRSALALTKWTNQTKDCPAVEYAAPDLKAAIAAIRVQLEAWGAIGARRKLAAGESTGDVTHEEYAKMTPKDKIQAHLVAIEEEKAKLDGKDGMH